MMVICLWESYGVQLGGQYNGGVWNEVTWLGLRSAGVRVRPVDDW